MMKSMDITIRNATCVRLPLLLPVGDHSVLRCAFRLHCTTSRLVLGSDVVERCVYHEMVQAGRPREFECLLEGSV